MPMKIRRRHQIPWNHSFDYKKPYGYRESNLYRAVVAISVALRFILISSKYVSISSHKIFTYLLFFGFLIF
jgi:cytosine/uracil/thiamine/allantoin permease